MMLPLLVLSVLLAMGTAELVRDPMDETTYFHARPAYVPKHIYVKPSDLVTRDTMPSNQRLQFITDYPYPGGNQYIKPGDLVATASVGSKPLYFRNTAGPHQKTIDKKKNILYVAQPVVQGGAADIHNQIPVDESSQ